jgi:aryl-alcohol dehydrogenase-like predicted oxidoreductase
MPPTPNSQQSHLDNRHMKKRKLGRSGLEVSALGFGCMSIGIADVYTSSVQSENDAIGLVHRALDLGVNFLDTANIYGDSEIKVGKALRGRREGIILATKFGIVPGSSYQNRAVDGSPENARRCCDLSLQRLGVNVIDLYYLHRVDPRVKIEETVGAMADLVRAGKVRYIGLSEIAPATVRRAQEVHPITAVQTEYSLFTRDPEDELLPVLRELGTSLVAYSPLGRGFLGARFRSIDELAPNDWRRGNPRFQGEQFQRNLAIADTIAEIAREKGVTPAQLALAWVLTQGEEIVPIPGTSNVRRLEENVHSLEVILTRETSTGLSGQHRRAPSSATGMSPE